jgi:type I restriction enzyme R subunit
MNEAQTRLNLIDPAIRAAGWTEENDCQVLVEQTVAPGRVGKVRGKPLRADYILCHRGRRLVVVEAKGDEHQAIEGYEQALKYGRMLGVQVAYATNGREILEIDLATGGANPVSEFPAPQELWSFMGLGGGEGWVEAFSLVPLWFDAVKRPRYYQELAVNRVTDAIAARQRRILLTLATGTGKTFIAFQIAWKLFKARWNLQAADGDGRPGARTPRILFITDRNILANQGLIDFSGFDEHALARVTPKAIHKRDDKVPTNATVFFTIYETLMQGEPGREFYRQYAPDFFDFIIIDECHRGGAKDESTWRQILEYFEPAYQLGMTATPKRDVNADTYRYFGRPVYEYSLLQGIEDGFLTPFRVQKATCTIDDYEYDDCDTVVSGEEELDKEKTYEERDFYRGRIRIRERDEERVRELLGKINPMDKTIIFCYNQPHAMEIMSMVNKFQKLAEKTPDYCRRVTANDGEEGERFLREFQNNEKQFPVVLTTSQKLSTGVDARNVRNIVLMRPVNSMVEFKQIVGRGTRLFDGKPYFTIYDFTDATDKFTDPEWDGETVCPKCGQNPCVCGTGGKGKGGSTPPEPCPKCGCLPCVCEKPQRKPIEITLSSGRTIAAYWKDKVFFDNEMLSAAEFLTRFATAVRKATRTPELLRACWADMAKRKDFIEALAVVGFDPDRLREIQRNTGRQACDILDVMLDIAYDVEPVTREFRALKAERDAKPMSAERKALFDVIVGNYVRDGVWTLTAESFRDLLRQRYSSLAGAYAALEFSTPGDAMSFYDGVQRVIYAA